MNGTSITGSSGSPIYVKNASEVKIKSEENSFNEVIDNRAEATEDSSDDTGNAAIYATCDLKLVGKGALVVTGNYNNGIQSKDDLSIKNVIVKVTAVNNAVKGNDAVDIESGNIIAISLKAMASRLLTAVFLTRATRMESLQLLVVTLIFMQPVTV